MMVGPKAPKDPTKKQKGFYVMLDKEIEASDRGPNKPSQEIYLDGGRLVSFAKIVGNIQDKAILDLLTTSEGFKKLVHSIGVSVTSKDKDKIIDFKFQTYGKKDTYGGGTVIEQPIIANGAENIIDLTNVKWSDDDWKPGNMAFLFDKIQEMATVSVKLYVHDGFDIPDTEEDDPIAFESKEYADIIGKSLLQMGNNYRIKKVIEKAEKGEDVTLAYIGGSITQGAGAKPINLNCYAYKSYEAFCDMFAKNKEKVHYVKAGVGGTPSELGMIRYNRDVLKDGEITPDIVFVEFAVNDEGDETKGKCFESLVRKILNSKNAPAVILLFSVFANDMNLEDRLRCVGENNNIPMVSIKEAVVEQFYLKKGKGRVLSKNQFFYDAFHPSNTGHRIMADCITNLFKHINQAEKDMEIDYKAKEPVIGGEFENVFLLDRRQYTDVATIRMGGFTEIDEDLQSVERNLDAHVTPQFPYNWMKAANSGQESFQMEITSKALLIVNKDSGRTDFGKANVFVDGKLAITVDPKVNGWTHCNPLIIYNNETSQKHMVEICMVDEDKDKCFTILGFGVVTE